MKVQFIFENLDYLRNILVNLKEHVKFINNNTIYEDVYSEAYRVIGITFNDKRFK